MAAKFPCRRCTLVIAVVFLVILASHRVTTSSTASSTGDDDEDLDVDMDFPDDPETSSVHQDRAQTPLFVYVLRMIEILTGAESAQKHRQARGAEAGYPDSGPPEPAPTPASPRGVAGSYSNYYDFLINEGSYKFWAAFEVGTAVLLIYSAFAALYYARYTYYTNVDYSDYDDYFFKRRSGRSTDNQAQAQAQGLAPFAGLSSTHFQRVMDAVDSERYRQRGRGRGRGKS